MQHIKQCKTLDSYIQGETNKLQFAALKEITIKCPLSIIFYVVKEPENEIHILRVLREERDWGRILKEQQEYTYPKQKIKIQDLNESGNER